MWRFLFKRLWAHVMFYSIYVSILFYTNSNPLSREKGFYAALAIPTLLLLGTIITAVSKERHLDRLGKRAPAVRSWAPYGLDTLFWALYYFSHWRNHEFWYFVFESNGNKWNPWTVEELTVGERIIFTADEENIKAVLATQ